jgi:hypothetical protein
VQPGRGHGHAPVMCGICFSTPSRRIARGSLENPEPKVEFEVQYQPRMISISEACGLLWNCTDILPGTVVDALLLDEGLPLRLRTYAAAARAMKQSLEERS